MGAQKCARLIRRNNCLSTSWTQPSVQGKPTGQYVRASTHKLKDTQIKSAHQDQQLPRKSAHMTSSQSFSFILKIIQSAMCHFRLVPGYCSYIPVEVFHSCSALYTFTELQQSEQNRGCSRGKKVRYFM